MLICLTGHSGRFGIALIFAIMTVLAGVFTIGWAGGKEANRLFLVGVLLTVSLSSLVGTVLSFVVACRRRLISTRLLGGATAAFLALLALLAWRLSAAGHLRPVPSLIGAGLMAWCVAPFAMAPLAVIWNRNR
jgi:hypothetical protein